MKKAALVIGSAVIGGSLLTGYVGLENISSNASASEVLKVSNADEEFQHLVDHQGREYGYDKDGEIIYFINNEKNEETDGNDDVLIPFLNSNRNEVSEESDLSHVSTISDEINRSTQDSFDTVKDQVIDIQKKNVITKENSEYESFGDLMNDLYAVVNPWKDADDSDPTVISSEEEKEYYNAAVKFISYAKYFENEIEEKGWVQEVNKAMVYNAALVNQNQHSDYSTRLNFGTGIINISADYNN